ncbi:MAG: hypothetical protein ACTIA6_12070 [Pseudoclavibacter sp.]
MRAGISAPIVRQTIDPSVFGEGEVVHYSIPSIEATGSPVTQPASELASMKQQVRPGDVLISKLNPRKSRVVMVQEHSGLPTLASPEFVALRPRLVDGGFLKYFLQSGSATQSLAALVTSATRSHQRVDPSDIRDLELPDISKSAQAGIARTLDRETAEIDAFIADQEKLIELLTERRSAVISHAVFPDRVAATPNQQTLPLRRFGPSSESGTSVNAFTAPAAPGEVGVLKTGAASSGVFLPQENKAVVFDEIHRVRAPVRPGTVILNRANTPALVGSIAYVDQEAPDLYLSDKLWQIDFARADARFIAFWAQTRAYRSQIESLSVGASSSMQNLSYGDFLGVRMPNLPRAEQTDIANHLEASMSEIDATLADAREAIALLKERRAALISAAVTGKIYVPERGKVMA